MTAEEIIVRCVYGEEGGLSELLEAAFRRFLRQAIGGEGGQAPLSRP